MEQLPRKKFNPPGGKRYLQPLFVCTGGVGWILLCSSGHHKHLEGICCGAEQQHNNRIFLEEFRPANTHKKRAYKQEKNVTVSKYRVEGPGLGWLRVPWIQGTKDASGPVSRWHPELKQGKGTGPKIWAEGDGKEPEKGGRRLYKALYHPEPL